MNASPIALRVCCCFRWHNARFLSPPRALARFSFRTRSGRPLYTTTRRNCITANDSFNACNAHDNRMPSVVLLSSSRPGNRWHFAYENKRRLVIDANIVNCLRLSLSLSLSMSAIARVERGPFLAPGERQQSNPYRWFWKDVQYPLDFGEYTVQYIYTQASPCREGSRLEW